MHQYLYWICFIVIVFYIAFDRERVSTVTKYILYLPLILLLSVTMAVTIEQFDIAAYSRIFNRLDTAPDSWRIDMFPEYGYQYLNYFFNGVLGWDFEGFRLVYAFAVLSILFFSVSRLTKEHGLFFLLYYPKYFLIGLISHSRSGFVNAFIFFAIDMAEKKKFFRLFLMSSLLSQIHFSAFILNIFTVLRFIKLRLFYVLLVVPLGLVFADFVLPFFLSLSSAFDIRQLNYLLYDGEQPSLFGIEFIRRVALIVICAYIVYYKKIKDEAEALLIKIFMLSVFVYIGFYEAKFIADRVGGMLGFVEPLLWIIFLRNHFFKFNRRMVFCIVIGYALLDFFMRAIYLDGLPGHGSLTHLF